MTNNKHWKVYMNPDFLGAYALEEGKDLIATIDYRTIKTDNSFG